MQKQFRGVYTAIITPFVDSETVDWGALEKIVEFQIDSGVAGIVPCGTTGEAPTISTSEQTELIRRVVKQVNHRCQVIAGTGSNSTAHAITMTKSAEDLGVDGCLVVNPYYNKPTQEGLYRHFKAIADAVQVPIIVYNIKGRTGVNLENDTLSRLVSSCPNIISDKEASGDLTQIKAVIDSMPSNFSVLSGDDSLTTKVIALGGDGIISVASNLIPASIVELTNLALSGDFSKADKLNSRLASLFDVLFVETNPIPIKAACSMYGLCREIYRLPMCELRPENRAKLERVLSELDSEIIQKEKFPKR